MKYIIKELDTNIVFGIVSVCLTVCAVILILRSMELKRIEATLPKIQQVGIPFYFTNTVILIVPTNSIPLTNVITVPTPKSN